MLPVLPLVAQYMSNKILPRSKTQFSTLVVPFSIIFVRFLCYLPRKHVWLHWARRNSSLPSAGTLLRVGLRATMIPRMIARTVGRPTIGARRGFAKRALLPVYLPGTAPVVPSGPLAKDPRGTYLFIFMSGFMSKMRTQHRELV